MRPPECRPLPLSDELARLDELLRQQVLQETCEIAKAIQERVRAALRTDPPHSRSRPRFRPIYDRPVE